MVFNSTGTKKFGGNTDYTVLAYLDEETYSGQTDAHIEYAENLFGFDYSSYFNNNFDEEDPVDDPLPSSRTQINENEALENAGFELNGEESANNSIDLFIHSETGNLCISPVGSDSHIDLVDNQGINIGQQSSFSFLAIDTISDPNNPYGAYPGDYLLLTIDTNNNILAGIVFNPDGTKKWGENKKTVFKFRAW